MKRDAAAEETQRDEFTRRKTERGPKKKLRRRREKTQGYSKRRWKQIDVGDVQRHRYVERRGETRKRRRRTERRREGEADSETRRDAERRRET